MNYVDFDVTNMKATPDATSERLKVVFDRELNVRDVQYINTHDLQQHFYKIYFNNNEFNALSFFGAR